MQHWLTVVLFAIIGMIPAAHAPAFAPTPAPAVPLAQRYTVEATFEPEVAMISGDITVVWTNTTGEPQEFLPFRLYPNAEYYGESWIELVAVDVDGEQTLAEVSAADPTVMHVPFGTEVPPGEKRAVSIAFATTIPVDSAGSFGIFRANSDDGTWSLVNWYPIVAGWEQGEGWYLDPPAGTGDPTFVTASSWDVSIAHPESYALVATGQERTTFDGEGAMTTIELPVGRELAMVALPADRLSTTTTTIDDLALEVTLPEADAIPGMAEFLSELGRDAIPRYGEWFEHPVEGELDITVANLDGALGVSWSGAIWLDLASLTVDGVLDDAEREGLRFVVYHEIGHQWLANVIGTNSNDHTFLTEGLVNVTAVAIVRDVAGPDAAQRALLGWVAGPYRAFVNGGQDAVADTPVGELEPVVQSFVTYGKGGVGFEAIRQHIGDDAFFDALAWLAETQAWGIATPDGVREAFERASGQQLDALWSQWFQETGTTLAEIDAVIAESGT